MNNGISDDNDNNNNDNDDIIDGSQLARNNG